MNDLISTYGGELIMGSNMAGLPERFFRQTCLEARFDFLAQHPPARCRTVPSERGIFPQQRCQESDTCTSVAERFLDQDVLAQSGRPTRQPVQEPDAKPKR